MMNDNSISISFWMYALRTTVYILNIRYPSKAFPNTTYELWTSRKPSCFLTHLHVWSCQGEMRIYNPHEKKLDSKNI